MFHLNNMTSLSIWNQLWHFWFIVILQISNYRYPVLYLINPNTGAFEMIMGIEH